MVATSCRQWTQVNVRQTYGICAITIVTASERAFKIWFLNMFKNLPVISLVAEKWQVMASEHTSTMWSPCDNHAITSRAEVVANWPHVNARQSHDKRATIFATLVSLSSELMPSNSRPEYALHAHVETFCAPSIWKSWILPCFSACDVHLVVYAMQSNHGQFFSSRCARQDVQANIASCRPTGCIAAAMFLRWSHFRNVLKWMYVSSSRA